MNQPDEQQWRRVEQLAEALQELPPEEVASHISRLAAAGESPTVLTLLGSWLALPPPSVPLQVGSVVSGRYKLKEKIGEGGMGSVWRAEQRLIGRDVALKILHTALITPDFRARFVNEIELLGRLNHPGIVRIYDAGIHEQTGLQPLPFFTMELVQGVPLDRWAEAHRNSRISLLRLMVTVCEAVQNAHERRVVHRDLKPGNVLVREDGFPVVLDFGIARLAGAAAGDEKGMFSGTPQYAAPEQHLGRDQDFRSGESVDVYSTGVILFQILSGRRPFEFAKGSPLTEIRRAIVEGTAPRLTEALPDCEPFLEEIVARALRKDPADRFYSMAALGRALSRAAALINHVEPAPPPWTPAPGAVVPGTGWKLTKRIGEGGVGQVWLGIHDQLTERRVFKFCDTEEKARTLKRELTLFRLLKERVGRNPHFVQLHEVSLDETPWYLMMDYCEAKDLQAWAADQPSGLAGIPIDARMEIVAQAAEALQAAHEAGILHRDIKPSNLLVRGSPVQSLHVLVADFGIGQIIADELLRAGTRLGFTQTVAELQRTSISGTMLYMAPEVLEGNAATARSDIYSLGIVMWQLLIGNLSAALDPAEWAARIDDPLLRGDLAKCLAGTPEKRWPSAGDLAASLRALPTRRAALAQREAELASRERAAYRRGLVRAAGVAGAVIALVASLAWMAWKQRGVAESAQGAMALEQAASLPRADLSAGRRERGLRLLDTAVAKVEQRAALRSAAAAVFGMSDLVPASFPTVRGPSLITNTVPPQPLESCRAASHDGKTLAVARDLDGLSGVVELFDLSTGEKQMTIQRKHFPWIPIAEPALLRFSPDDKLLALGGAETSRHILLCNRTNGLVQSYIFISSDPASCAWHPSGFIAVGCTDATVSLWDPGTARKAPQGVSGTNTFDVPPNLEVPANDVPLQILHGHRGAVRHVAFSPNGQWLASLDNVGYLRIHTGGLIQSRSSNSQPENTPGEMQPFELSVELRIENPHHVTALEWSGQQVLLYRTTGREAFEFVPPQLPAETLVAPEIKELAWSLSGTELAAITLTDVHWIRTSPFEFVHAFHGKNPDGIGATADTWIWPHDKSLLANRFTLQDGEWKVSTVAAARLTEAVKGQGARSGVAVAGDGRVAAYFGRRVQFFDQTLQTPAPVSLTNSPGVGEFSGILWDAPGHLLGVVFSKPDGPIHLEAWSTSSGFPPQLRELAKVDIECRRICAANRDALFLCRGGERGLFYYDAASGTYREIDTSTQARQNAPISVSADGQFAAVVADRTVVRLLRLPSGEPFAELHSPRNSELTAIKWDHSGQRLATVTRDGYIQVWNLSAWHAWLAKHRLDT